MIRGRCPICEKPIEGETLRALPQHPFCSDRCRLIDLGRWLDGRYRFPAPPTGELPDEESSDEPTPPP